MHLHRRPRLPVALEYGRLGLERWLLEDGLVVVEVPPTLVHIAPALERLLKLGKIAHANHPILAWNAANTVADVDAVGKVRPSKARSGVASTA